MQALIIRRAVEHVEWFEVTIQPIEGEQGGLDKMTEHRTKAEAYRHARTVLGLTDYLAT